MTYHVLLTKPRPVCPFRRCGVVGQPVTEQHGTAGWTVYRYTHTRHCWSRMWGSNVPRGHAFAPGEFLTDRGTLHGPKAAS